MRWVNILLAGFAEYVHNISIMYLCELLNFYADMSAIHGDWMCADFSECSSRAIGKYTKQVRAHPIYFSFQFGFNFISSVTEIQIIVTMICFMLL